MMFGGVECEAVDKLLARTGDYFFYVDERGRRVGQIASVDEVVGMRMFVTELGTRRRTKVPMDKVVSVWRAK
jgi:hypothetical protein